MDTRQSSDQDSAPVVKATDGGRMPGHEMTPVVKSMIFYPSSDHEAGPAVKEEGSGDPPGNGSGVAVKAGDRGGRSGQESLPVVKSAGTGDGLPALVAELGAAAR